MTTNEMRQVLDWADANKLQYYGIRGWYDVSVSVVQMSDDFKNYRIKPTPSLRPWRPEEVPVGAVVRNLGTKSRYLITDWCYAAPNAVKVSDCEYSFAVLLQNYEHSLDHGKTWLPCGVAE